MFKITDYFKQANSVKSTEDHGFADLTCSGNYLHEGSISSNNNVAGIIMKAGMNDCLGSFFTLTCRISYFLYFFFVFDFI